MLKLLPASAAAITALLAAMPLYAQNGDMFGDKPKLSPGQSDILPTQTQEAPSSDVFHDQATAPARDVFPEPTPNVASADMFGTVKSATPQDVLPNRSAPTPPYPLYHNSNENSP